MVILMLISCVGWVCTIGLHTINVTLYCLSYSRKVYRQIPSSVSHSPAYVLDDATLLVDDLTTNFVKWIVSSLPCTSVLGWPTKIRTQTKGARLVDYCIQAYAQSSRLVCHAACIKLAPRQHCFPSQLEKILIVDYLLSHNHPVSSNNYLTNIYLYCIRLFLYMSLLVW